MGAISIPLTENKLSSLCNNVWLRWVWICQESGVYLCLREDHSSTPAERDNKEREWFFENRTCGKALELSILLEVCMSPNVLRHVGGELHSLSSTGSLRPGYLIGHA